MEFNDNKWSTLAQKWMFYLPPGRPSFNDLRIIENKVKSNLLKERNRINALVLGSTPEYRDLLFKIGATVTVVDRNREMVEAMKCLRAFDSEEIYCIDDWFDFLPEHMNEYDLILADYTQGNIPYDKHVDFYHMISNALTRSGIFLERTLTFRDPSLLNSYRYLCEHFANSPINLVTLNNIMSQLFFTSDLIGKWELVDVDRMFRVMDVEAKEFPGLRRFIHFMKEYIFGEGIFWYYGKNWSEISKSYFKYLKFVEEIPDTETAYRGFSYIIISTKKKSLLNSLY